MTLSGSTSSPDSGCSVGKKQYTERESKVTVPSVSSCFAQKELVHFNCKQITTHTHKKKTSLCVVCLVQNSQWCMTYILYYLAKLLKMFSPCEYIAEYINQSQQLPHIPKPKEMMSEERTRSRTAHLYCSYWHPVPLSIV